MKKYSSGVAAERGKYAKNDTCYLYSSGAGMHGSRKKAGMSKRANRCKHARYHAIFFRDLIPQALDILLGSDVMADSSGRVTRANDLNVDANVSDLLGQTLTL